jgi:hypothetical protein
VLSAELPTPLKIFLAGMSKILSLFFGKTAILKEVDRPNF